MFPTMAVTIPIKDDQRWSWESPLDNNRTESYVDNAPARINAGASNTKVADSIVEVDKYMTASLSWCFRFHSLVLPGGPTLQSPRTPPIEASKKRFKLPISRSPGSERGVLMVDVVVVVN